MIGIDRLNSKCPNRLECSDCDKPIEDQACCYWKLNHAIFNDRKKINRRSNIIFCGEPGSGKTFVINHVLSEILKNNIKSNLIDLSNSDYLKKFAGLDDNSSEFKKHLFDILNNEILKTEYKHYDVIIFDNLPPVIRKDIDFRLGFKYNINGKVLVWVMNNEIFNEFDRQNPINRTSAIIRLNSPSFDDYLFLKEIYFKDLELNIENLHLVKNSDSFFNLIQKTQGKK